MKIPLVIVLLVLTLVTFTRAVCAQASEPNISNPSPDSVLRGIVVITGTTDIPGFISSELSFAYEDDPTGTWFYLSGDNEPARDSELVTWDTTKITDGSYNLRLRVYLADGSDLDILVTNLVVKNESSIEIKTPTSTLLTNLPVSSPTSTSIPFPTPTSFSPNQAIVTNRDVSQSILYGVLAIILLTMMFGLLSRFRKPRF